MGEVWRAFDLKLRVDVALKAVRFDLQNTNGLLETLRRRCGRRARWPRPTSAGSTTWRSSTGASSFRWSTFRAAPCSRSCDRGGPLELQEAREIASQLLAGLEAIHHAGLVHRDLKPENVMITPASRVVVMDFGIAKGLAEARTGTVAGTPAYMAPEQGSGEKLSMPVPTSSPPVWCWRRCWRPGDEDFREDAPGICGAVCVSEPPQPARLPVAGCARKGGRPPPGAALRHRFGPGEGAGGGDPARRRRRGRRPLPGPRRLHARTTRVLLRP